MPTWAWLPKTSFFFLYRPLILLKKTTYTKVNTAYPHRELNLQILGDNLNQNQYFLLRTEKPTMGSPHLTYDFIVVGAGPAGCTIASRLAQTKSRPSVLLLEAGGDNEDINLRVDSNKFIQRMTESQAYGYKSIPQPGLNGREITLDRGKGLGGSSAIHFTAWTKGARDDMDTVACLTGDDEWTWEKGQERWKSLERFHGSKYELPKGVEAYLDPQPENHGSNGPIHICFPTEWDSDMTGMPGIWKSQGFKINRDASSGEHLGLFILPLTSYRGVRVTSKDLLMRAPQNLHISTDAPVHKVLFQDKRAAGVSLINGRVLTASKEIIIAAGTLDSPKILMHSGIGPAEQLQAFNIPILHENPNVGQNYKDHYHIMLRYQRAEHTNTRSAFFRDKAVQAAALREWVLYRTGPYANLGCGMSMGFFKNDAVLDSQEYSDLPDAEKERLALPTIPSYEVCFNATAPDYYMTPDTAPAISTILIFVMNGQGKASVRLQSSDPTAPLLFEPSFLEHPYDKRVAIEATRETLKVTRSAEFQKDNVRDIDVPKSDSDEDILAFWRENLVSTWHMNGTAKMGKSENEDGAVVDIDFRVFGVQGLRVADMSVMPVNVR